MTPRKPSKSSPLTENSDSTRTPRPNSGTSEIADPMRRSFSGNPFQKPSIVANPRGFNPATPANSPSDWAMRGKESNTMRFLRESEEKENGRDSNNQKRPAAKSPSVTNSKGMKNFMSPTISAASKINASPNKKILTERNSHDQPPLRSSVTSLDLRSSFSSISNLSEILEDSETRFDKELDLKEGAVLDPTVTAYSLLESNDIVEEMMKLSCPSALEPIDADPRSPIPPYDPKTNFLAPRPKFLYYKPKEMDCNPLDSDDELFSDSFSESEATEETESDSSQKESAEAVSSHVVVAKEEEEEGAADTEPSLHRTPGLEKEAVTEKERSRHQLFTRRSKGILSAFILVLIAFSTMMETDHLRKARCYNSMIKESSFPVALEVVSKKTDYLRRSVGANLRLWCDFSVSYVGGLMSELRGEHRLGHVIFFNLTNLEETQWNGKKMESLVKDTDSEISGKILEQNVQIEAEEEEESDPDSRIEDEVEVDAVEGNREISNIKFELSSCTDNEEVKSVEVEEEAAAVQSGIAEEVIAEEKKIIIEEPELVTIQSGEVEEENILKQVEESEVAVAAEREESELLPQLEELIPTDIKIVSQDSAEAQVPESIESSSNRMTQIAALSSLVLSIVAGCAAFKKIRSSFSSSMVVNVSSDAAAAAAELEEEEHILGAGAKKFNISPPVSGKNNLMAQFDFVGDSSWPSEISQEEEHKGLKNDILMNPGMSSSRRRESLAASSSSDMSMGGGSSASPSLSYGSFTTYEMIPTKKKRNGDEELVITPLRRSSRLRK